MGSDLVHKTFQIANDSILKYAENDTACKGMGCTAELLAFSPPHFVLGHMGDSRTYRLRKGNLKQLTTDHSLVQEQLDQGQASKKKLRTSSMMPMPTGAKIIFLLYWLRFYRNRIHLKNKLSPH